MDERRRRIDRFIVVGAVTAILLGFALLSDGFSAFRVDPHLQALSGDADARWRGHLARVEQDLRRQDVSAAIRAWHDAHGAALESRRWEAMLEVGDAALELGRASGSRVASQTTATDAYLVALIRARREASLDGALRVAERVRQLKSQIDEPIVITTEP